MKRKTRLVALIAAAMTLIGSGALAHDIPNDPAFDGYHWRGYHPKSTTWKGITVKWRTPSVTFPTANGNHGVVALSTYSWGAELALVYKENGQYVLSGNRNASGAKASYEFRTNIQPNTNYWIRMVSCASQTAICARYSTDGVTYTQLYQTTVINKSDWPANEYFEVIAGIDDPAKPGGWNCSKGGTHPTLNSAAKSEQTWVYNGTSWVVPSQSEVSKKQDFSYDGTHYPDSYISGTTNGWQVTGGGSPITCSR